MSSELENYVRLELWVEKIEATIDTWENVQGIHVPQEVRDSITKFMRGKIKRGIEKKTLMRVFMQIAVTSLLYIKLKVKR